MTSSSNHPSVIVVGSGNAALCAAIAAQAAGARTLVIEKAPETEFGGNSRYTAGAMRFTYDSGDDLAPLLDHLEDERLQRTNFGCYTSAQFLEDFAKFNGGREITPQQKLLVAESRPTVNWLASHGVRFEPIYSRQAFERDGQFVFWGGLTLCANGEGDGLVLAERERFLALGGKIKYDCEATGFITDGGRITGLQALHEGKHVEYPATAVVFGCGGFEANPELREQHIGAGWSEAKVRGTRHNMGAGIGMARAIGAAAGGWYEGCHAVPMDLHMPNYGNPEIPHIDRKNYRKISYPFGVMLNARGERFVDEGADFRNYTYAQFGKAIIEQPGRFAWQIFDDQVTSLMYEEYWTDDASSVETSTLEQLVERLDGVEPATALRTLLEYNQAVDAAVQFDPTVKDGRCTRGLTLPKSNWALALDKPPFRAYPVTCGITFTYGGLKTSLNAEVLNDSESAIPGLFACGELVGDVFFEGYPGGSGLTSGAVFGKRAGESAAKLVSAV